MDPADEGRPGGGRDDEGGAVALLGVADGDLVGQRRDRDATASAGVDEPPMPFFPHTANPGGAPAVKPPQPLEAIEDLVREATDTERWLPAPTACAP